MEKRLTTIRQAPAVHWVGDGFPETKHSKQLKMGN